MEASRSFPNLIRTLWVCQGLFDADVLAELTEDDRFLGPMKRAIVNKGTFFTNLGSYMAQLLTKAALVNDCVIVDNKLAIPEPRP